MHGLNRTQVVLARAALFTFPCRPRSLDLVLRLRDHYGYLFCIMIDEDRAFLGCTPEQLFKVRAGKRPRKEMVHHEGSAEERSFAFVFITHVQIMYRSS